MKTKTCASFKVPGSSKLCVAISTTAFSLEVDCPDIRHVIHFTTPASVHQCIQETVHAVYDGQQSYASLLCGKGEQHVEP